MKPLKTLILAATLALAPLAAFAQSQTTPSVSTDYQLVPIPFLTLAGNTLTNFSAGWSVTNTTTTTNLLWNTSSATFVPTITTNTVIGTTFANFDGRKKTKVPLQFEYNTSDSTSTSNLIVVVSRSVTGVNYDTANNTKITNNPTGNTIGIANFTVDMTGFNYGRIVSFNWTDTTAGHVYTNLGVYASAKAN